MNTITHCLTLKYSALSNMHCLKYKYSALSNMHCVTHEYSALSNMHCFTNKYNAMSNRHCLTHEYNALYVLNNRNKYNLKRCLIFAPSITYFHNNNWYPASWIRIWVSNCTKQRCLLLIIYSKLISIKYKTTLLINLVHWSTATWFFHRK